MSAVRTWLLITEPSTRYDKNVKLNVSCSPENLMGRFPKGILRPSDILENSCLRKEYTRLNFQKLSGRSISSFTALRSIPSDGEGPYLTQTACFVATTLLDNQSIFFLTHVRDVFRLVKHSCYEMAKSGADWRVCCDWVYVFWSVRPRPMYHLLWSVFISFQKKLSLPAIYDVLQSCMLFSFINQTSIMNFERCLLPDSHQHGSHFSITDLFKSYSSHDCSSLTRYD